jgi:hypothetical protein
MKEVLSTPGLGIKDWQKRGATPSWTNYTAKVIERSSHTYDTQPARAVLINEEEDEALTEQYLRILSEANFEFVSQGIDELSRLLKSTLLLVQGVEETESYNLVALGPHNSDVEWDSTTGTVKSIMYSTCDPGITGGQMFRLMTPETITDIEYLAPSCYRTRRGTDKEGW